MSLNNEGVQAASGAEFLSGAAKRSRPGRRAGITNFHLAIGAMVAIAALSVIIAALRMTDRAIEQAVAQREMALRFLESELAVLRMMAVTSPSPVPARLYLGVEQCFKARAPMPFKPADVAAARSTLALCADMELGRLYSQGGMAMANEGRAVLKQVGLLK